MKFSIPRFIVLMIIIGLNSCSKDNDFDEIKISDSSFKAALIEKNTIDTNGDGRISTTEAESFNGTINVMASGITSLDGIEYFPNMKLLHCENNSIESINLSNCVNLTSLWCSGNDITTLDLSNNKNLSELSCNQNQLTSLDVSNNPLLKVLSCYDNQITSLDLSGNTALIDLYCKANALEWLNIKNGANEYLRTLHTKGNPNLYCIQVDDSAKASQTILHSLKDGYNYYYDYYWSIDDISTFSENCN